MTDIVCPECKHANPAGVGFCGYCGTELTAIMRNSATEVLSAVPPAPKVATTRYAATCPHCGMPAPDGAAYCGDCGRRLAPQDAPQLMGMGASTPDSSPVEGSLAVMCPRCGAANSSSADYCMRCGAGLKMTTVSLEATALALGGVCSRCGYTGNESGAVFCIACGSPLQAKVRQPRGARVGLWLGLVAVALVVLSCGGVVLAWSQGWLSADVLPSLESPLPRTQDRGQDDTSSRTGEAFSVTPEDQSKATEAVPAVTPSITPTESPTPTVTPTFTPSPSPTVGPLPRWESLGASVERRAIPVYITGPAQGDRAIVVVGSIQGDQINTSDLLEAIIDELDGAPQRVPSGTAFHIIPSINPDGNAHSTRRNAHNVDLNRNWDTWDWRRDAEQPGGVVAGSGGASPFSEPETRAMADYLLALRNAYTEVHVVLWHSSQRVVRGEVYAGGTADAFDSLALRMARRYSELTGYVIEETWGAYTVTGEMIVWCAENGIPAIDVVLSHVARGSDTQLRQTTTRALLDLAVW